jgi:hypothetical protein
MSLPFNATAAAAFRDETPLAVNDKIVIVIVPFCFFCFLASLGP